MRTLNLIKLGWVLGFPVFVLVNELFLGKFCVEIEGLIIHLNA